MRFANFPFGRFEIVHIAGVTLGRATYQPGWKWSVHNAPIVGTKLCHAPHTGTVLSGHGAIQYEDGQYLDLLPGTVFHITTKETVGLSKGGGVALSSRPPK